VTMDTSLPLPSDPAAVSWLWRIISSLPVVRSFLGIREEKAALASEADEVDTSLTQAHLEILK
jgi:hypothetical protein